MDNKLKVKEVLTLLLSVGIIVPIWGTFHSLIGIEMTWPAFASSALFFAANCKIEDSMNIAFGHAVGVVWGMMFLNILNFTGFAQYDSQVVLFITLCILGMLAVFVTSIGFKLLSHLPSLFSGWAITVGALGSTSLVNWGNQPLDVLLSTAAGIFIVGVGISKIQSYLLKKI